MSTMNMRECSTEVTKTGSEARLPGLDSQLSCMPCVDLEQGPYTLCIVALSVKEELYLCIDDRVLVRIK